MTKAQLEKKYGIIIADDSYYNPIRGKTVKAYKYYSADGCLFSNGLQTLKAVEMDCREWSDTLIDIKINTLINIKINSLKKLQKGVDNYSNIV